MSTFDPYREWLGIESNRKPTYYQLIGVSPTEEDVSVIRKSALRRLEVLSRIEDPARQQMKQQLVQRVKRAAKCLMSDESRIDYDRKLLSRNEANDVVSLTQNATSEFEGDHEMAGGAESQESLAVHTGVSSKPSVARKYKSKQRKSNALLLYGVLGLISLVGICFLVATQTPWGQSMFGWGNSVSHDAPSTPFDEGAEPLPMDEPDQPAISEGTDTGDPSMTVESSPPQRLDDGEDPTPQEVRRLENALKSARAALENRDPAQAKRILDGVSTINQSPPHRAMYARLVSLTYFVGEYWKALDDAWHAWTPAPNWWLASSE